MSFQQGSIDLFTGARTAHMGSFQYVDHGGKCAGKSMSGAKLWAEIEATELGTGTANLFSDEERIIREVMRDIGSLLPEGTPVIELGTGTPNAFTKKTLCIMLALKSLEYICIDESSAFLKELVSNPALSHFNVKPILDDFFESGSCFFDETERDGLMCMFGSTIGNIVAPLNRTPPQKELTQHLSTISKAINRGSFLVSFDASHNGEAIKDFYSKQALFQLNTFYRMENELDIKGNFDASAFRYEAQWIEEAGQLAHNAIVSRDLRFSLAGIDIHLTKGQRLLLKNSFKYRPAFFKACCEQAGFAVTKTWSGRSGVNVFLLQKEPDLTQEAISA